MAENTTRRSFLRNSLVGGLGLILSGCDDTQDKSSNQLKELTIKVSQEKKFRGARVEYAGMPNKESFSLKKEDSGYRAFNVYYPSDSKEIYFQGANYQVISVDPNQITLKLLRNKR